MPTLLTILLALIALPASASYGVPHVEAIRSVYDGDTFRVDVTGWPPIIGRNIKIRPLGIDTPEIRSRCDSPTQRAVETAQAVAARNFTHQALLDAEHIDLRHVDRGTFFRVVAEVHLDGERLGDKLIDAGLAKPERSGMDQWCKED